MEAQYDAPELAGRYWLRLYWLRDAN